MSTQYTLSKYKEIRDRTNSSKLQNRENAFKTIDEEYEYGVTQDGTEFSFPTLFDIYFTLFLSQTELAHPDIYNDLFEQIDLTDAQETRLQNHPKIEDPSKFK